MTRLTTLDLPNFHRSFIGFDRLFDEMDIDADDSPHSGESVRQMNLPLDFERFSPDEKTPAPYLGAHTTELLNEIGYTDTEIETLIEEGAIADESGL